MSQLWGLIGVSFASLTLWGTFAIAGVAKPVPLSSGSGTPSDPYVLMTIEEVQAIENDLAAHYVLGRDIDASSTAAWNGSEGFKPIGAQTYGANFTGTIDGQGHTISGLHINRIGSNYQALIGVANGGTVANLHLVDVVISGNRVSGALVGYMLNDALVTGCSATGSLVIHLYGYDENDDAKSGGLVGQAHMGASIVRSYSGVNVDANQRLQVGGLVGVVQGVTPGPHGAYSTVTDSYSSATVTGSGWKQGNLVGDADGGIIIRCYSSGNGKALIGYNFRNPVILDSYWDATKGASSSSYGGTPKTTAEMMTRSTFVGWDFETVWDGANGQSCPFLRPGMTLTASPESAFTGQSVTLTARLGDASATGTITFTIDGVAGNPIAVSGGTAAMTTSFSTPGQHAVAVSYSGDASHSPVSATFFIEIFGSVAPVCGDQNGDGELAPTDVMYLINHLYAGGPAPANCPPVRTPIPETVVQSSGFYDLFDLSVVDPDLAPDNIRSGVSVFGVAGNPNVVNTSTGTATAADIALGKKAWVMGSEITGAAPSAGVPAPVASTGQTICFDATGMTANEIACAGTGQDGEKRKGVPWPNPRFNDNGNGAVTDNLTGLVWLKNANCFGSARWADALADANALASGACGLTDGSVAGDWRLPNVDELQSLLSYDQWAPALANAAGTGRWSEGDAFLSVGINSSYWSSTTYLAYRSHAHVALFADGITSEADKGVSGPLVWPVRDAR